MLFSFLVPVYNVEKYLNRCMDSLLCQKGADFEIVLLDDGSTDSSGEICDRYAKEYPGIVRVVHKENEGLLMTRRRGFNEAKGDYVACVDSDDFIKPYYLQTVVAAIQKYGCDMLMFDYESYYPDGHIEPSGIDIKDIKIYKGDNKKDIYKKRLLKNKYNNMWSKVIKKSIIDLTNDYGVFGVKNMCEDVIQSYELYTQAQSIVFIPQVLYSYRRDVASITSNISLDYWYALRIGYELGWKYIELWGMSEDINKLYASRCIVYYCDFLSWLYSKSGLTDSDRIKELISTYMLERKEFITSIRLYEYKCLPTKYLRMRNPLIIKSIIKNRGFILAKTILKIESLIKRK